MTAQEPDPGPHAAGKPADNTNNNHKMMLALIPKIPMMMRVALLHMLSLSKQSKYLDLRTEITVAVLRSFTNPSVPRSISATQKMAAQAPKLKGKIWVSTYTCPAPPPEERGLQDAIAKAIDEMRDPKLPPPSYEMPDPAPVEAEWTGYRADATSESRLPDVSERELYAEMMKEVKSPVTVLYFHGGAYYLLDPATHRPTTKTLAKLTGGRVYSVRYRLAPQHPFPAALMDALMSYLALLYPPEGAFHEPVKPEHIVFAGDSAGGNLALALLLLILHLNRQPTHDIPFHGTTTPHPIPLPAGTALNSPWLDLTHSLPSCTLNAPFDYLPTPQQQHAADRLRPPCPAWPASPPRAHLYAPDADAALLAHPLVSPVMAAPASWHGAPPVWMCVGWEMLADEGRLVAQRMWRRGVRVVVEEFEGMPHCFALVLPWLGGARRCLGGWAGFIRGVVEGGGGKDGDKGVGGGKDAVESRWVTIKAKSLVEVEGEMEGLWKEGDEVVEERVWRMIRERGVAEEGVAKL